MARDITEEFVQSPSPFAVRVLLYYSDNDEYRITVHNYHHGKRGALYGHGFSFSIEEAKRLVDALSAAISRAEGFMKEGAR